MKKRSKQSKVKYALITFASIIITAIVAKIIYVYFNEYTRASISIIGSILFAASCWLSIPFTKMIFFIFTPYTYEENKEE